MSEGSIHGFNHPKPQVIPQGTYAVLTLEEAVANLNSKAKQAFYTAAKKKTIKRGTWNGCAFNAAGEEVQQVVSSTTKAAQVFGLPTSAVSSFISAWDSSKFTNDEEATAFLISCLEKAGLYATEEEQQAEADAKAALQASADAGNPKEYKRLKKIYRVTVYKSIETQMAEFEAQFENDTVLGTEEAVELLCGV